MGDTEISPRGEATSSITPLTEFPQQHKGIDETSTSMVVCRYDTLLKSLAPYKTHVMKSQTISNISIPSGSNSVMSTNYSSIAQSKMFESTCSVYKQLMSILQPRTLSCMAPSSATSNTRALDTMGKIREVQQLEADIQQFIASETPMQRIRRTFTLDADLGRRSPQFRNVVLITKLSLASTFGFGFIQGWQKTSEEYTKMNKLSKGAAYKNKYGPCFHGAIKNGTKLAVTGGGLCVSIYYLYQFIEVYTNKSTAWSLSASFGLLGLLSRINGGFRGMVVGGILGTVLGLIGGTVTLGLSNKTKGTQEELNYAHVKSVFLARRQFEDSKSNVECQGDMDGME